MSKVVGKVYINAEGKFLKETRDLMFCWGSFKEATIFPPSRKRSSFPDNIDADIFKMFKGVGGSQIRLVNEEKDKGSVGKVYMDSKGAFLSLTLNDKWGELEGATVFSMTSLKSGLAKDVESEVVSTFLARVTYDINIEMEEATSYD